MSWYNDNIENNFIDATQEFTGGGISTSTTTVENTEDLEITETTPDTGADTTIGNVLLPAVLNENTGTYDLYIRNVNENGRIFITTKGDGEKIKIEDGKLFLYYDYDFINAPLIPGGWTDIINYSVLTRQLTDGLIVNVGTIDGVLFLPGTGLVSRFPLVESGTAKALADNIIQDAKIAFIENELDIGNMDIETYERFIDEGIQELRDQFGSRADNFLEMLRTSLYGRGEARNLARALGLSKKNFTLAFLGGVISVAGGLSLIAGIAFGIYDRLTLRDLNDVEDKLLIAFEKIKDEPDAGIADLLYKDGLTIQSATNGGFTTPGTYEVDIANNNRLEIEIDSNNIASIKSVILTKPGFTVGDVITIPKTDLGGGTGNLLIDVITLYNEKELLVKLLDDIETERQQLNNRQRRRQNIPTSSSFSTDGFNIVNTQITEPSTEITNEPTISLKIDTSQFQYDGSGNLQIQSSILAPQTDPNQFTTDPNSGNLQIINYEVLNDLLDHIDTTNNNLILGNETEWEGYKYDLITVALKGVRAGAFDSGFYNDDWLGYYPSLTRLSDDTNIEVVKDVSVQLLDDGNMIGFKKGLIYFKNIDQLKDYDLNRKFEFVCFIKPYNLETNVEYTLLQTGVKLAEDQHDIDNYKLKVAIKNNKLEITHTIKKTTSLGYNTNSYNNWTDYALGNTIQTQVVNGNQGETYVIQNGITHTWGYRHAQNAIALGIIPYKNKIFQRDITTFTTSGSAWLGNEEYFDMYFYNDYQETTPTIWKPSTIYYSENQPQLLGNNISKIIIQYKFFIHPDETPDGYVEEIEYQGANNIYDQVEFFLLVNFRKYNDPVIYDSRYYEFDQDAYKSGCDFYEQEIILPTPTPDIGTDYTYLEITLTHRRRAFTNLPVGSPSGFTYYYKQHFLRVVSINFYEYTGTATTASDWILNTFTTTTDVLPASYDFNNWYKFVLNTNLANKQLTYYVDDVENVYTFPSTLNIGGNTIEYDFANYSYNGLVRDNDIIIIGNEPSSGQMYFSHFIWNHFQDPNDNYMTLEERNKLDNLINYKYYYENVKVDRYLKTKEFYADVLDARKILVNGNFAFYDLTPAEQLLSLRSDAQTADDLSVGNIYVNIDKLFVNDPVAVGDGFLQFDSATRTFSIGATSVSPSDVENAVGNLIQITPSTYGLIFDTTNPNDKYIKLDDLYVNNLINLVIQNELLLSVGFLDSTYGDVLIQIKDASANSPYDLRELDDTNVRYNYVINGNHQYLYRELNQEIQYDPLLGVGFGPQYPVVMYHFQGEIINNARDWIQGIPASDYDFEQTYQAGQVVYGLGSQNKKNFNGVEGGSTEIRTKNTFDLTGAGRSCISFFHKPFGGNVDITDDHNILKIQDVANNDIITFRIEYISNVATYKLLFTDQTNIANKVEIAFNNSENEIYFGNENCILLWFDLPNFYWYINGKWHGSIINPGFNPIQAINYVNLFIDLFSFNNRSLLYELKVYPKLLFKTGGTSSDEIFNAKRVAEITEMIRIITFNTGGFILKELSGVQETKVRSIETKVRSLSTESRVSVIEGKASLPTAGTGVAGYVYNDGISSQYVLQPIQGGGGGIDLTAISVETFDTTNREYITFNHTDTGVGTWQIQVKARSSTSINNDFKLSPDYSIPGTPSLTEHDDPYPPYVYTFNDTDVGAGGVASQTQTYNKGLPQNGANFPNSFDWYVLSGDILKYTGPNGVWGIYEVDHYAVNLANNATSYNATFVLNDMTSVKLLNDGDEFVFDYVKYQKAKYSLYLMWGGDFNKKIKVLLEPVELYINSLRTGDNFALTAQQFFADPNPPLVNRFTLQDPLKQTINQYITDTRPQILPPGQAKVITLDGRPPYPDDNFKWTFAMNYSPIAHIYEDGSMHLNGDVYVNCPVGQQYLDNGTLLNSVNNIKNSDNTEITGLPARVDQVYEFNVDYVDIATNTILWTGSDRVNTYNNQAITQFQLYYNDTIRITFSSQVDQVYQSTGNFILQFTADSLKSIPPYFDNVSYLSEKLNGVSNPVFYIHLTKVFASTYYIQWLSFSNALITFNLSNIKDYTNEGFLTTDEYILKYKPRYDTYVWEENIGMAIDSGQQETNIPIGSFKARSSTSQISSRRTLSVAVPIDKVSQKTKYQVFNGEVEFNNDIFLEKVNDNIGTYFTIYTSEDKQDPITLVDNFKDKSSIVLEDATKTWIFKREPESEDIQIATTKFIHDTTELLILKHNEVEIGVGLKVGTITFADNTTLTTSDDLTGLLNDINTTNPSYTEFAKNIKLPNGDIISSVYDDADVRSVLSSSAGTGITWNATNNQFDNSITQYTDTNVRSVLSSSAGTGITWNATNNQFDNDITQYTDADVRSVLSSSAGTGITWNATNNQFDNSITQYTDADARSAVYPITQTNSGLPVVNGGMELFDNNVWYNTTDGRNRFYFTTDGSTTIRAPDLGNNSVSLQIGVNDIFKSFSTANVSYKNLYIGNGLATTPTLFLDGANGQSISSQIVFGDSGTYTGAGQYDQGMVIFYDSSANYLRISGDNNVDSVLDTPYFLNINRADGNISIGDNTTETGFKLKVASSIILKSSGGANVYDSQVMFGDLYWLTGVVSDGNYYYNQVQGWWNNGNNRGFRLYNRYNNTVPFFVNSNGNVGINTQTPSYALDVNGSIHTSVRIFTPQIDFDDGTSMTSASTIPTFTPSILKVNLNSGFLSPNYEPGANANAFNTTALINIGSYSIASDQITIPSTGIYEISYSMRVRNQNTGVDRKTNITYVRVNDLDPGGNLQAIGWCYVRFRGTSDNAEGAQNASTILELNQNDLISLWSYREGASGQNTIQEGYLTIKRIG
jgi:hypothetical protein